jgi:hypothetical protein
LSGTAARSSARTLDRAPPKRPMGVRMASQMNTSHQASPATWPWAAAVRASRSRGRSARLGVGSVMVCAWRRSWSGCFGEPRLRRQAAFNPIID